MFEWGPRRPTTNWIYAYHKVQSKGLLQQEPRYVDFSNVKSKIFIILVVLRRSVKQVVGKISEAKSLDNKLWSKAAAVASG